MAVEPEGNQGSNFGASFSEEQFYPAPPANENELPTGFFVGREEEQARFREMLQSLSGPRRSLLAGLFGSNKKQGRVAGTIQGRVVAVSGVAGAGKTRLSLRLREISQKEKAFSRRFYVTRLDWHEVRERDHRMTPHYGNQAISPDVFLDIIYTHFVREEQGSYFEAYKSAVEETRELARQVSGAELMAVYEYRAKALGKSLLNMSSQRPLLFFLDNYELVADRDDLLRAAMQESGPEVVWIIAGQGELGDYTAERFLQFQLGPLTQAELLQFFKAELSRYQDESKTGAASFYRSPEQIVRLHEITGGLPLAARLATFLLQTGLEVAELPAGSPNPVETLLDEFLNGPLGKGHPDRTKLYALALLRRPERGVLSALLDLRQDLVPLSEVLNLVQSRYAFLFEPVREMVLHPAIEQPMRTWMLQPAQRQDEQGISRLNRRAMGFLTEQMNRWGENFPSLQGRVREIKWREWALDKIWHAYWLGPEEGWREALPLFVAGLAYRPALTKDITSIIGWFEQQGGLDETGRQRLRWLEQIRTGGPEQQAALLEIQTAEAQQNIFRQKMPRFANELALIIEQQLKTVSPS